MFSGLDTKVTIPVTGSIFNPAGEELNTPPGVPVIVGIGLVAD